MAKRQLNRRQNWRIEKIQNERAARAAKREQHTLQELEGGDLGPEQLGLVIAHFGVQVEVEAQDGETAGQVFRCHLRANLPALVTGDQVVWRAGNQGIGVIVAQLPRKTELCRPDSRGQLKPVAANVDMIVIVFAPLPEPHANLIDRYLVAAEHAGIRPLLLLNKFDLIDEHNAPALNALLEVYRTLGYPVLEVSAHHGNGMETRYGHMSKLLVAPNSYVHRGQVIGLIRWPDLANLVFVVMITVIAGFQLLVGERKLRRENRIAGLGNNSPVPLGQEKTA